MGAVTSNPKRGEENKFNWAGFCPRPRDCWANQ